MAFDEKQTQQQQQQLQQQQQQQPIYAPQQQQQQQQFMAPPMAIVPQVGQMAKHKIQAEHECGYNVTGFKNCYPSQLSNNLSSEEYAFIVEKLNRLIHSFRKTGLVITLLYIFVQFSLVSLLIFGSMDNSMALIGSYIALNILVVIIYIIILVTRNRRFVESLKCTVSEINSQYTNRNIRLEAYRKVARRVFIVKARIYYPPTLVFTQAPQMYNYQQQPQQQYYAQSPVYQQQQPQYVPQQPQPQYAPQQQQQTYGGYTLDDKTTDSSPLI
ncbi:hypothetical protein DDB_G0269664 [Dictyostelium discoideum AX4]|uniref:Transmembrane protein n=1 Tax=Dictyostelium discoideum TaxID=44689 RepID=Q55DG8_DICDI|nr:hypothetical protein DDB_G0269664 [Dictyostelium discoideum AX4]EAL72182.1 hypothetical protein DDB_G0269664 [Dictyostelium discoideum AX4]|eukprot:XP_646163.1 hypothetical protein DDB_G0269664 [Dictyostelium discoideum AX4]